MIAKNRLSATVDADLIAEAEAAVARGEAGSVSAWVNEALRMKAEHDRALRALSEFVTSYESRHGEITPEQMRRAHRRAGQMAIHVRGPAHPRARRRAAR
jgi:hypothetical protein